MILSWRNFFLCLSPSASLSPVSQLDTSFYCQIISTRFGSSKFCAVPGKYLELLQSLSPWERNHQRLTYFWTLIIIELLGLITNSLPSHKIGPNWSKNFPQKRDFLRKIIFRTEPLFLIIIIMNESSWSLPSRSYLDMSSTFALFLSFATFTIHNSKHLRRSKPSLSVR